MGIVGERCAVVLHPARHVKGSVASFGFADFLKRRLVARRFENSAEQHRAVDNLGAGALGQCG